jgi:hypothetical protein
MEEIQRKVRVAMGLTAIGTVEPLTDAALVEADLVSEPDANGRDRGKVKAKA